MKKLQYQMELRFPQSRQSPGPVTKRSSGFPAQETLVDAHQPVAKNNGNPRRRYAATRGKLNELRCKVELLGDERLRELRPHLNWLEREVLDRRGIKVPPETCLEIASRFSVSHKTVRKREIDLLAKLTAFSEKGELPSE